MRTQQQAEREEQQRIKNLVLNYDLTDDQQDGEAPSFHYVQNPSNNRVRLVGKGNLNQSLPKRNNRGGQIQQLTIPGAGTSPHQMHTGGEKRRVSADSGYSSPSPLSAFTRPSQAATMTQAIPYADGTEGAIESQPHIQPARMDKSGNTRSKQRSRKLQLGDIDWYGRQTTPTPTRDQPASQISLDSYVVNKSRNHGKRHGPGGGVPPAAPSDSKQASS